MKILIVDDDPAGRNVLRQVVEHYGHEVVEAGDGQEGLEKASQHRPDAIISDGLMPKMDGFQFLKAVRQDETLSSIPFVFYTGIYTDNKEYELALTLGADALIVKPTGPANFWMEFTSALDAHASKKKPVLQQPLTERNEDYFRDYCRTVAAKLEEKVSELEETIKIHRRTENDLRNMEKKLKAASGEWRSTLDVMSEAVALMDSDGKILRCNRAMAELLGKDFREIVGRRCSEIVHGTAVPIEACPYERIKKTLKKETIVLPVGSRWFEVSVDPILNSEGNLMGAVHIMADITEQRRNQEKLQEQIAFTGNLLQNSAVATFVLDARHSVLIWNRACEELTGFTASAMLGTNDHWKPFYDRERPVLADIVMDGDADKLPSLYARYAKSLLVPHGLHSEGWYKNMNGRDRYIAFEAAPILNAAGENIAVIETLQDITERKLAEEQISQITREWEETFNTITDMVTIHDKDFNIIRANKAAEKILGLPFLDVEKVKCFEYYHGAACPPDGCPSCQSLVTGKPSIFELFEPHLNMHIEIQAIPRLDSNNQVAGLIHVVRDITERKKAEEALGSYSRELTALSMASDTLMLIANLTDIYGEICNIIYSVFDLKMVWLGIIEEGSFQVKPVADAGHEDGYLSSIRVTWDDAPSGMGPTGMAIKTKTPSLAHVDDLRFAPWREEAKKRGYVMRLAVPLMYARDKCIGVLNFYSSNPDYFIPDRIKLFQIFSNQAAIAIENAGLIEDLEGRVFERTRELEHANQELQAVNRELVLRREEADASNRSKSDFLSNMSHELRTPLNAILGFSEIMLAEMAGPLNEKQKEFLADISTSGNHLLSLITDILDLSKIEAGKLELELRSFSLKELIQGSLVMFKQKALKHNIDVILDMDEAVTGVTADERKLKQVLVNLLSNAFKFTPDGGSVQVTARLIGAIRRVAPEKEGRVTDSPLPSDNFIEISVSDTGIGISKENQQRLFHPFQQIETSLNRKYAGTGLGLSLCRRLIELHGGRIWVESEPGKGSRFVFVIPVNSE